MVEPIHYGQGFGKRRTVLTIELGDFVEKKESQKKDRSVKIIYKDSLGMRNKFLRQVWHAFWFFFFRPTPVFLHPWRSFLLRLFGSKIEGRVYVYPDVRIFAPWNLTLKEGSSLGPGVDCYCVDKIEVGPGAVVSQRTFLCTASHDIRSRLFELVTAPISIGGYAWIAAEAFIGPGVNVGEGAVVGARACVIKGVKPWTVVAGNPARQIKRRILAGRF